MSVYIIIIFNKLSITIKDVTWNITTCGGDNELNNCCIETTGHILVLDFVGMRESHTTFAFVDRASVRLAHAQYIYLIMYVYINT